MLYIQDDRYFGSLYGLETHDKKENAGPGQKMIFSQAKVFCTSELNLLKISSLKAFFHIPLLYSKHPVNNILQELINQEKKKSPFVLWLQKYFHQHEDIVQVKKWIQTTRTAPIQNTTEKDRLFGNISNLPMIRKKLSVYAVRNSFHSLDQLVDNLLT